ncbi:MAG: hypothetical protein MJ092_00935 [Lachnospiraceae bacterium]|nr:hypothetical protein [Lachnospiraceae bacterium]
MKKATAVLSLIFAALLCVCMVLLPFRDTRKFIIYGIVPYKRQTIKYVPHIHIPTQDEIDHQMSDYVENPLTVERGAIYYNDHKETYYSQNVLPGESLDIPGRHVAFDGTIRDEDGYICVAADYDFLGYGEIVETSAGWGKVYDTGCAYGTVDLYVDW